MTASEELRTIVEEVRATYETSVVGQPIVPALSPTLTRMTFYNDLRPGMVVYCARPAEPPLPPEWWLVLDVRRQAGLTAAIVQSEADGYQEYVSGRDLEALRIRLDPPAA